MVGVEGEGVKSSEGRSRMVREGQGSRSTVGSITLYRSLAGSSNRLTSLTKTAAVTSAALPAPSPSCDTLALT